MSGRPTDGKGLVERDDRLTSLQATALRCRLVGGSCKRFGYTRVRIDLVLEKGRKGTAVEVLREFSR